MTDPRKGYHLELATTHQSVSRELEALMREMELEPKAAQRKGNSVIYFKQSDRSFLPPAVPLCPLWK